MATPYVPPGVLPVRELQPSPLSPGNVVSTIVPVLIGEAQGYQSFSENITVSGTTTLTKKGIVLNNSSVPNLSFTVSKPSTFETVGPANFIISQVAGTASGDETTTFRRISYPSAPSPSVGTAAGSVIAKGDYRYAVSYILDIDSGGGTAYYETGIGTASGTVTIGTAVNAVSVSGLGTGDASITVVARNVYRSQDNGSAGNPNWGPWYRLPGTADGLPTVNNGTVTTYSDTTADPSSNNQPVAGISTGDVVTIQYNYADVAYWQPTLFSDFNDIVEKYGDAFDSSGGIDSELSFAAKMSILNGATQIVAAPVPANPLLSDWEDALLKLEDDEDGNIIVPITGSSNIFSLVTAHITKTKQRNLFKTAILGMDGSGTAVSKETLRAQAESIGSDANVGSNVCLVSPATFSYYNSFLNTNVSIGGQYAAAALAGMHASRSVAESLTRKQLAGLSSVSENRSTVEKNQDAGSGLVVVEQIPSTGSIRVRHEITTTPEDINKREFSVALQRNNMVKRVSQSIDENIIGQIYADSAAPGKVAALVDQILRGLVNAGELTSYTGLSAKVSNNDPTLVEVRWQYKPVYTVQYVQITFGINLSGGGVVTGGGINLIL